jgi:outer membrane protein assembly factor BamA
MESAAAPCLRASYRLSPWMRAIACTLFALSAGMVSAQPPANPAAPAARTAPPVQSTPQPPAVSPLPAPVATAEKTSLPPDGATPTLAAWRGLRVEKMEFQGVTFGPKDQLPGELAQQEGQPLDPAKVAASLRRLFASGRYRDIRVEGARAGDAVTLVFAGTPRYFVGKVTIEGVKEERLASLLEYATKLNPGAAFTDSDIAAGEDGVKQALAGNGYFQPKITSKSSADETNSQMNVTFTIDTGPLARIGSVTLEGKDAGFTPEQFRKEARLKQGKKVSRDTVSNALTRLRSRYQKEDRLEATATLHQQTYNPQRKQVDYDFSANQGPLVKVSVEGMKLPTSKLKLLVPIYQEGTIDNDLLNEGTFNIQDYLFREGYFDAKVTVRVVGADTPSESVVFSADKGVKRKVASVTITGNKYFDTDLLKERMQVQRADLYVRNGRYSPALMKADVDSILSLYRANGFNKASVSTAIKDIDTTKEGKKLKVAEIDVQVKVSEGEQQKFGTVVLTGVDSSRMKDLKALMNAQTGQPYSLITLSGDRDAILDYYLSHGFSQARVEVKQQPESDPAKMDVTLGVTEGEQVFIDQVLLSGIVHTKSNVVDKQVKVHASDPLDQSALLDTQRNLYGLALFNEVTAAVQNPDGDDPRKNVLLQLTEARRWDVTYGFGFEAETGTPQEGKINCASAILLGIACNQAYSQNGKTGVSPRVSLDVSRINLRGTDESLTLHSTYGLLEEVATLTFQNPHFRGRTNLSNSISGGYSNVQNITTFQASTLQGDFRISQKVKPTDTLIYNFVYRRVAVNPATLQVSANLIPQLSQPVRVGGPGLTWFHDTRDPGPLDATRGSYTSVQEFFASSRFGSQANFNRVDVTNSSYYTWGKKQKYTLARSTRLGFETTFGPNPNIGSASCVGVLLETNASCNAVPLPERLYAGGATSHRGFGINDAGPRDLQTGFPVGGNGVFVNSTELRMPPFVLPWVGDNLNFVIFHDMGNVFAHVSDTFPSIEHFHQPNQQTCANLGSTAFPFGTCDFNYYSHAIGGGARYRTPVGPIRVDFSYNLNPPVYPVIYDFNGNPPNEGQASHFNFFFSIGEAF